MAKAVWDPTALLLHEQWAYSLLNDHGHVAMQDYLDLVEDAVKRAAANPNQGSPTISQVQDRRVMMTIRKKYQVHYDYDPPPVDTIYIVSITK